MKRKRAEELHKEVHKDVHKEASSIRPNKLRPLPKKNEIPIHTGTPFTADSIEKLMHYYIKTHKYSKLSQLYFEFKRLNVPLDHLIELMFDIQIKHDNVIRAVEILYDMEQNNYIIPQQMLEDLMVCFDRVFMVENSKQIFEHLRTTKLANSNTYTNIFNIYIRNNRHKEAIDIIKIHNNSVFGNNLLKGYIQHFSYQLDAILLLLENVQLEPEQKEMIREPLNVALKEAQTKKHTRVKELEKIMDSYYRNSKESLKR